LFRASLIESWGQGIFKMIADCTEAKVPPPVFKYDSSEFVIEFQKETDSLLEETREKTRVVFDDVEPIETIAPRTGSEVCFL